MKKQFRDADEYCEEKFAEKQGKYDEYAKKKKKEKEKGKILDHGGSIYDISMILDDIEARIYNA